MGVLHVLLAASIVLGGSVRQRIVDYVLGALRQRLRELDVKGDHEVAFPGGLLGEGQTVALDPLNRRRLHDLVRQVQRDLFTAEGRHIDDRAAQRLLQADLACVPDIAALPPELWMRLIPDDKDDVRGYFTSALVTLLLERNLCAGFPAGLDVDSQHLVLLPRRAVGLHDSPRDLHLLGAAAQYVLEADVEVVLDRRILGALLTGSAACGTGKVERVRAEGTTRSSYVATLSHTLTEAEGIVGLHIIVILEEHALLLAATATGASELEEGLEGRGSAEELGERGAWVAVEGVGIGTTRHTATATATTTTTHAALQALFAELIVDLTFLRVGEDLVGLGDLFELLLGARRSILVRVVFERELAVGFLYLVVARTLDYAKDFVVVFPHGLGFCNRQENGFG